MNKPIKILIIAIITVLMLTIGIFSSGKQVKAQDTSGIVTIAFDDGNQNQFQYAYPLLQQYGMNATFYVITGAIGTSGYLTIPELQTLQANGSEIGSHSVTHPDFETLTPSQINYECNASQQFLQSNGLSGINFAYPQGYSNSAIDSIVLQYYRSARYSYGADWLMSIPPTGTQKSIPLGVAGEQSSISTALTDDELAVNWAHEYNYWVLIFFHNVVPNATAYLPYGIDASDFSTLLSYISNSGVRVLTVNQAQNLWSSPQRVTVLPSSSSEDNYPYISTTMDAGQSQSFTAIAYGGTSPYSYQWYLNGRTVGNKNASYTFDASTTGSFSLYTNATDSAKTPIAVESNTESITVNSALSTPTVSASADTVDQGQTSTLTSSDMSTGTSPYTYQWFETAPDGSYSPISGATSSSYSFDTSGSTATGSWSFELQVTDAVSEQVTSNSVAVEVNAAPTASVSPTSWTMDTGQSETFSATASEGSGSYLNYQWYVDDEVQSGMTASTFSYSPSSSGAHSITVTVTDSLDATSTQSTASSVTVNESPTVSVAPVGPLSLDVGQVQMFTATASGGSGSLSYQWYLDGNAVGRNRASYSYTAAGSTHSVTCKVTDSASVPVASSASNIVSVTVNPALTIPVISASLDTVDQGQTSTFGSSAVSTGTSPYSYQWLSKVGFGSYSAISGATSSTYSFVTSGSTATGVWSFELQVTDSASIPVVVTSSAASVTVNAAPTVTVSPTSWSMDIGQSKTFTAASTGGSGTYSSYQWYVDSVLQSGHTASTFSYSPGSSGSHPVTVTVTDDLDETSVQSSAVYATVNSALVAPSVSPATGTVDQGQSLGLAIPTLKTGTSPYTYQWFNEASGASSYTLISGGTLSSYNFVTSGTTAAGKWSFMLQVTDTSGASVNSTVASVTVNSALAAPTTYTSASTVDQGQTSSLSISAVTTGTSPYTYQWFSEATTASSYSSISGSVSSSYNFVTLTSTATGSWNFVLQVTDSTGAAVNSTLASVTVNAVPTVSVAPSSVALDVGQIQTFKATPSGGTGPLSYQWYLDGVAVGTNSASYSYTAAGTSHSVTCTVTDSASVPVASPTSSAVSVTVNPTPTPTPTPAPPSSHASSIMTVAATTESGATVDLALSGNITSSQMSNIKIATNQSALTTTVSFILTGESGAMGFGNLTIPKSALPYGATPTIYVDGQPAQNQGYTQDTNNYYVWYTTHFSTDQISIVFASTSNNTPSPPSNPGGPNQTQALLSLPQVAIYGIAATVAVVAIVAAVLMLRKSRKGK